MVKKTTHVSLRIPIVATKMIIIVRDVQISAVLAMTMGVFNTQSRYWFG